MIAELGSAFFCTVFHLVLYSNVEAAGGAGLDACGLESLSYPIGTECAFKDFLIAGIEFWNVEWATCDAISAADAMLLLKIHNAVGVLHNGAIGGGGEEKARFRADRATRLLRDEHPSGRVLFLLP